MLMLVLMLVLVLVLILRSVIVIVSVLVVVLVSVRLSFFLFMMMRMPVVIVMMILLQVNIEFHAFDARFFPARHVEVITVEMQFFQFVFEPMRIDPEIDERAQEHVAAHAAEDVEIKRFHMLNRKARSSREIQDPSSKASRARVDSGSLAVGVLLNFELGVYALPEASALIWLAA